MSFFLTGPPLHNVTSLTGLPLHNVTSLTGLPLHNVISLTGLPLHNVNSLTGLPLHNVVPLLCGLAQWVPDEYLHQVLQLEVDVAPNGIYEHRLHAGHQQLQPLDHRNHLHQRQFFFMAVVVARCLQWCHRSLAHFLRHHNNF